MNDAQLRKLEADAARGDPAAIQRLAAARIRAARAEDIWQQFEYAFDLVQLRPWDEGNVALLRSICMKIPATDPTQVDADQQHIAIDATTPTQNWIQLTNVVIRDGNFTTRNSDDPSPLHDSSRVVIFGGDFGPGALDHSSKIIIFNGTFHTDFHSCKKLTILNGVFTNSTNMNVENIIILGGDFTDQVYGDNLTILGGNFPQGRFASTLGQNVHVWLPRTRLRAPAIPRDATVVARSVDTLGVDEVWRSADMSFQIGNGRRTATPRTAFYLAACPQPRLISPELQPLFFSAQAWDILPVLRTDRNVDRTTLSDWLDVQAQHLRQTATPCFPR